jgi:hypothetical protein
MINRFAAAALALSMALAPASVPAQDALRHPRRSRSRQTRPEQDLDNILFLDLSTGRRYRYG